MLVLLGCESRTLSAVEDRARVSRRAVARLSLLRARKTKSERNDDNQ